MFLYAVCTCLFHNVLAKHFLLFLLFLFFFQFEIFKRKFVKSDLHNLNLITYLTQSLACLANIGFICTQYILSKLIYIFIHLHNDSFIKRGSKAKSFTIFENHVYTSKKDITFAINFVHLAPFLVESLFFLCYTVYLQPKVCNNFCTNSIFSYAIQAKVCHKFCTSSSIFGRKFVFLMLYKQKFSIHFVQTPFLIESLFFLMLYKPKFAINFVHLAPFLVESLLFVWNTSKSLPYILQ